MEEQPRFLNWFTVTMWVLAILMVLGTFSQRVPIARAQAEGDALVVQILQMIQVLFGVLACLIGLTATLRGLGSRLGNQLTAATNIVMAFIFPFGTVVFVIWIIFVRPRETLAAEFALPPGDPLAEDE